MGDLSNAESAWLRAKNRFDEWRIRFEADFEAPKTETLVGVMDTKLSNLPGPVQQISRQQRPEDWKQLDARIKQVQEKGKI